MLDMTPNNRLIREILEKLLSGAAERLNLFHGHEASKEFTFGNYSRPTIEAGWLQIVDSVKPQALREMARLPRQSDDSIQEPTFVPSF
jgi:hypothetical protein